MFNFLYQSRRKERTATKSIKLAFIKRAVVIEPPSPAFGKWCDVSDLILLIEDQFYRI